MKIPVCAGIHENQVFSSNLPQGPGLASNYAGDSGIQSAPEVIFADDFEAESMGMGWDEIGNPDKRVLSFEDPKMPALGNACLKVRADLEHNTGGGLTRWFESAPVLFIRFYTKFDASCDYTHHFVTLRANRGLSGKDKWSGFGQAGRKPDGTDRFSTGIEPWGEAGNVDPPGRWSFYTYWPDMQKSPDGKFWGNTFQPERGEVISRDEWICVEFMLKHNTPGKTDGEQAFWINGVLQGHWKGIQWRTIESLHANSLSLESYVTDRWTKNPINVVFFDNLVIARSYIGPVGVQKNPENRQERLAD